MEVNSVGVYEVWRTSGSVAFMLPTQASSFYPLLFGFSSSLLHNVVGQSDACKLFFFFFQVLNSGEDYSSAQIHYWTISSFPPLSSSNDDKKKYPKGNVHSNSIILIRET